MQIARVVGPKGQVVVPQPIREEVGITPGTEVVFDVEGNTVVMRKKKTPQEALEAFINVVPKGKRLKKPVDFKKIYEEQYLEELDLLPRR